MVYKNLNPRIVRTFSFIHNTNVYISRAVYGDLWSQKIIKYLWRSKTSNHYNFVMNEK